MSEIVIDQATLTRLTSVAETVTITDPNGKVVGHFIPALDKATRAALQPRISEDEIRRREQQGGGRPLAEILRDLEQRG